MEKRVSDSITHHVEIIMPQHINGQRRLFGGVLMQWIDVVAAVTARRHSGCNVVTAAVDNLNFKSGANINDSLVLEGRVTYAGTTSMEVRVDTFVEKLDGEKKEINRAYFVMVALDEDKNPTKVPKLIIETDEEKEEFEAGRKRYELRKIRKKENY
ncbi:MAG: acyl-CoA thioesterase [Clostridia bacterium]|nr:acyl-CoA thioesterase [Clostridia bacterium]